MTNSKHTPEPDNKLAPPRDYSALRDMVVARWEDLPKRLTEVARYALDNPDEIAFGTAASIAAKANVQPSTLVRFSQSLGYQGFSDLQDVFRSRLRDQVIGYDQRLAKFGENADGKSRSTLILEGVTEAASTSLAALQSRTQPDQLDKALDILTPAETIYLVGLRRSFPATSYLAYVLGKLGIKSMLIDAVGGLAPEQASFITPQDAAITISFTPYASETVALTQQVRERGAKVVAITDSVFSPLTAQSDLWFELAEADFEGFRTLNATITLAMAIAVGIADRRKATAG
ncbi:MurR/RpiR family transcriptional regulator [Devosia sp. MC532]|uniref:MurR/RpiR family transcriptional regulator n=1 Tax=Devosia sp. MC532 TaxID=2799788 RepID=UPI0018F648C0|nr:MurR/RpiR family transcriptional regulator [Devosia sp. MC532]MBJ7577941.1 MurR/RpiR family transcriptional regulator [Devosia sp. MC532]